MGLSPSDYTYVDEIDILEDISEFFLYEVGNFQESPVYDYLYNKRIT